MHPGVYQGGLVVQAAAHADTLLRALRLAVVLLSYKQRRVFPIGEGARALTVLVESTDGVKVAGRAAAGAAVEGGGGRGAALLVVGRGGRVHLVLHVGRPISGCIGIVS